MSRLRTIPTAHVLLGTLTATGCIVQAPPAAPAQRVADPQITRCADWRQRDPSAGDGDYPIFVQGRTVTVYCHDMAGQPREYLSVRNGDGANAAAYGIGPNTSLEGLITSYTRVRLDPAALAIDPRDATFATSNGGSKHFGPNRFQVQEYGTAGDCAGDGSQTGRARIDLTGTPFAVVADQFVARGSNPAGTATYSERSQVVTLTGGGYCGDMVATSGQIRLGFVAVTSCRDVSDDSPDAPDGEYTLDVRGRRASVYCHDMAGQPTEYLTLPRSIASDQRDANYSHYGAGGNTTAGGVTTWYQKVRLHLDTLTLEPADATFATRGGGEYRFGEDRHDAAHYGVAADCVGDRSQSGRANIDLTGTPFAVAPDQFEIGGNNPDGAARYAGDQVVDLRGGGYCGWIRPRGVGLALSLR